MQRLGKYLFIALFLVAGSLFAIRIVALSAIAAPNLALAAAPAVSLKLTPIADAYLSSRDPSTNFGTAAGLYVASVTGNNGTLQANTLLRFDLSAIPAGSIIDSAILTLYQRDATNEKEWPLTISRITQSWSDTSVTFRTQPTAVDSDLRLLSPEKSDVDVTVDLTPLVHQWRYEPFLYPNHGILLSGTSISASRLFDSMEGPNPPILVIEYTPPPAIITIPYATNIGKLDAVCDAQDEYANALRYQYIDYQGAVSTLYLKQDDEFLYACVEGTQGSFALRYFGLYLDRNNGQEKYAEVNDLSLRVRVEDGATAAFAGTGQSTNTWIESTYTNWRAVATPNANANLPESAEYQLPLSDLATTCGQPFGLALYHQAIADNGVDFGWPTNVASFSPSTWVQATLARPICPIRVCLDSAVQCTPIAGTVVHEAQSGTTHETGRAGYVIDRNQIDEGTAIWAMVPISVTDAYTLYYTSGAPQIVNADAYQDDPAGEMTLVVSAHNPLMLHNLDLSAQWNLEGDATYKAQLRDNLIDASRQFYDFTNGQMALGTITVRQNYEGWDDADVWLFANNNLRPEAEIGGSVQIATIDPFWDGSGDKHKLVYEPGRAYMGSTWNRYGLPGTPISGTGGISLTVDTSGDWSAVLAHELGHYLLFLDDTYFRYRSDFVIENVYSCTGSAMGWVYFEENTEFVADQEHWNNNCLHTSHNDLLQRTEWQTMRLWYPWLASPTANPGPAILPAALTNVNFIAPADSATPLLNQLFDLDYRDGETASAEARALLYRNDRVIDQGKPAKGSTQILLHGAQEGDRLCLIDINDNALDPETPRNQYGCEAISAGDNSLFLKKNSAWAPVMLIDPITPTIPGGTTLVISVTQPVDSGTVLKVRVYPEHEDKMSEVTLSGEGSAHSGVIDLPFTPAAYVQLLVDESEAPDGSDPRREAIIDYGVGGGGLPGPKSAFGFAPIISSSDGRAFFVARAGLALEAGQFIALQSMAGTPPLPGNTTIVDQPYRLIAYPKSLVESGSINLRFAGLPPLQAAAHGSAVTDQLYFWDGANWISLATTLATEPGGNQLASAASMGSGIYALLQTTNLSDLTDTVYLPLVQR